MRTSTKLALFVLIAALVGGGYWYIQKQRHTVSPTAEVTKLVAYNGGCNGASCNGKDPADYCPDGRTVAAMNVPDGMLELRYSASCVANWARIDAPTLLIN